VLVYGDFGGGGWVNHVDSKKGWGGLVGRTLGSIGKRPHGGFVCTPLELKKKRVWNVRGWMAEKSRKTSRGIKVVKHTHGGLPVPMV